MLYGIKRLSTSAGFCIGLLDLSVVLGCMERRLDQAAISVLQDGGAVAGEPLVGVSRRARMVRRQAPADELDARSVVMGISPETAVEAQDVSMHVAEPGLCPELKVLAEILMALMS
jgi:hypothetical protein